MFFKISFSIAWLLAVALPSGFAQDRGRRVELEESLQVEISVEDLDREDFNTVGTLADYVARNVLPEE